MSKLRSDPAAGRGFTLVESLVALAILALVLSMSYPVLIRHKKYLERMEARAIATRSAEIELETLLASPFSALAPRALAPATTDPPELARLAGSRMTHSVAETDLGSLRRLRVEVRWREDGGRAVVLEALVFGGNVGRAAGPASDAGRGAAR